MDTHVEHPVSLARGQADIDVYATDGESTPPAVYFCECKRWATPVPQTVVHAFRTVVEDAGANFGLLISSQGFQSGAIEAANKSSVKLLTWEAFQRLFLERWINKHLAPTLANINDPLIEYTEPINTRIFRKADALSKLKQQQFTELRERYGNLAFFAFRLYFPLYNLPRPKLELPLSQLSHDFGFPEDLMHETLFRPFLCKMTAHIEQGIRAFDAVFGERA